MFAFPFKRKSILHKKMHIHLRERRHILNEFRAYFLSKFWCAFFKGTWCKLSSCKNPLGIF